MQAAYEAITARDSRGMRAHSSRASLLYVTASGYRILFTSLLRFIFCNPHSVTATHRLIAAYFDAKIRAVIL